MRIDGMRRCRETSDSCFPSPSPCRSLVGIQAAMLIVRIRSTGIKVCDLCDRPTSAKRKDQSQACLQSLGSQKKRQALSFQQGGLCDHDVEVSDSAFAIEIERHVESFLVGIHGLVDADRLLPEPLLQSETVFDFLDRAKDN